MEIIDVVNKLIGPVIPVADAGIDSDRYKNLEEYCHLAWQMLTVIEKVAKESDSQFASVKKMGWFAEKFIDDIKISLLPEPPKPSHNG